MGARPPFPTMRASPPPPERQRQPIRQILGSLADITREWPGVPVGGGTPSWVPDITAWAANWIACCDEPHWRSMVTAGTLCGSFEASTALRPHGATARPPG